MVSIDKIKDIRSYSDILELHGEPDDIETMNNNFKKLDYHCKIYNIFLLECIQGEYHYVLNGQGEVIDKNAQIIDSKLRFIPINELPKEFNCFK